MAIRTIFSTAQDCSRGAYEGWYELVRGYGPIASALLSHYFRALAADLGTMVTQVFANARADDNAWFRSLRFSNEREFAMYFRELVFSCGRAAARVPAPGIPADKVFAVLEELTLIERQFLWQFIKGWDVPHASAMLMNASATGEYAAGNAKERLSRFGSAADLLIVALLAMDEAQSRKTDDCLSWKTFNNLVNGQISWNDREFAERHMTACICCLDSFTAFQEMIYLQRTAEPLGSAETDAMVAALEIGRGAQKGLLGRLFSRAS